MFKSIQKFLQRMVFEDSYPKILDVRIDSRMQMEDHNNGMWFEILRPMHVEVLIQRERGSVASWEPMTIEIGFMTDLASVDSIPLIKINKLTIGNRWYVVHDKGYQEDPLGLSQKQWDTIMLLGLKKDGASSGLAWRRWLGVQIGGRKTWNRYRNR